MVHDCSVSDAKTLDTAGLRLSARKFHVPQGTLNSRPWFSEGCGLSELMIITKFIFTLKLHMVFQGLSMSETHAG